MTCGDLDFPSLFAKKPLDSSRDDDGHLLAWVAVDFDFAARVEEDFCDVHVVASEAVAVKSWDWSVERYF